MSHAGTAEDALSEIGHPNDRVVYVASWAQGNATFAAGVIAFFSLAFLTQSTIAGLVIGGLMLLWAYAVWQAPKFKRVILTDRRLVFEHSFGTQHVTVPVDKIERVSVTGDYVEIVAGSIFNKLSLNLVDGRALAAALDVLMAAQRRN